MSVGDFLSAIEDYLELKRAAKSGMSGGASDSYLDDLNQIKKRVALLFNELVDFRLDGVLEFRQKRASSTHKSVTVPDPDMDWVDVIAVIDALNSAPSPLDGSAIQKEIDSGNIHKWLDCYKRWFEDKRVNAIKSTRRHDQ